MGNGNGNGKKTSAQLDGEINDILHAREKREAKARATVLATAKARASTLATAIPSRNPRQAEYERRELTEAQRKITEVEKAPLAERKEAAAEFFEAMRDNPDIVAERVGWLLDGNYGYGSMLMAKQILGKPRMNRSAALTHMVAAFEWSSPGAMTVAAWKKLTKAQQAALERAVQAEIRSAETAE